MDTPAEKKPLILVVDDEPYMLELMNVKLTSAGYAVKTGHNAAEAVRLAHELKPDLILMDINMPGGATGTDAALQIKQNPDTKDIKIAFLSSVTDPWPATNADRKQVTSELGLDEFLDKAEDINKNLEKIKQILARPK